MTDAFSGAGAEAAAAALEAWLGDPSRPGARISAAEVLALDEREAFPEEHVRLLIGWGFLDYAVPLPLGGKLRSFEEIYHLTRAVARRDMVVANVLGTTLLGSVFTWIAGSPAQKARLAAAVRAGGLAGLALTEEDHGSDAAASEVVAVPTDDGYELTGTKWLVNNGSRSHALTVLAAVPAPSGRELAIFLVEKGALPPGAFTLLPKIRTLGVRGLDLCAIRFDRCPLPRDARLGGPGAGMDTLMRGLYLTRALCAGLSLGTADTALRLALAFARGRRLYGATAFDIEDVRARLAQAFADLLLCECVTLAALRTVHAAPEQVSVAAAVVKYLVPTTVEAAVRELALVFGARHFLRDPPHGTFQKMMRDGAVVSLFDGSTAVNLYLLGLQLDALARGRARAGATPDARAAQIFSLTAPLPPFDPGAVALANAGRDLVVESLAGTRSRLAAIEGEAGRAAAARVRDLLAEAAATGATGEEGYPRADQIRSPERFHRARRYAALYAAAAAARIWLDNRERLGGFFAGGAWLPLALARLADPAGRPDPALRPFRAEVAAELSRLGDEGATFSLSPLRPEGGGART